MPNRVYGLGRDLLLHLASCALALVFFCSVPAAAMPAKAAAPSMLAEYLADPGGTLSVQEAASPASVYRPFQPFFRSFPDVPGNFNGAIWLRFTLGPSKETPESSGPGLAGGLHLDLGTNLPGVTRLFTPQRIDASSPVAYWQAEDSAGHVVFPLPGGSQTPHVVYARLDGLPGLWFKPALLPAAETVPLLPLDLLLPGALAAALIMQLLRFSREKQEWRLWAALLAGAGLVQFFLPALPVAREAYTPVAVCAILAPGFALMLLSHTGRHLFATPQSLPAADAFLRLCPLLGAALALAPLLPDQLRLTRYLPFWPLLALPLALFAVSALSRGLSGALGYLCVCLMPIAGTAASFWETTLAGQPVMGATGGIWGLALGSLALALASAAEPDARRGASETASPELALQDDVFASLDRSGIGSASTQEPDAESGAPELPFIAPADNETYDDSALSAAAIAAAEPEIEPKPFAQTAPEAEPEIEPKPFAQTAPAAEPEIEPKPFAQTAPAAEPEIEPKPFAQTAPEAEPEIEAKPFAQTAGPDTSASVEETADPASFGEAPFPDALPLPSPVAEREHRQVFDLILLIKDVYDALSPLAERKNMSLTWFVSPQVGRLFEGEASLLDSALRLLLRDLIDVSDRGNVRLSVRRLPDSSEIGHLVFTITEWDGTSLTRKRNLAGLSEAWALAEKTGGIFSVEHSPQGGTTVIFSTVLHPTDKARTAPAPRPDSADRPQAVLFLSEYDLPRAKNAPVDESPVPVLADLPELEMEEGAADLSSDLAGSYAEIQADSVPVDSYEEGDIQVLVDHEDLDFSDQAVPAADAAPPGIACDDCLEETDAERDMLRILVADMTAGGRKRMAQILGGPPRTLLEAVDPAAALALYRRHPSGLALVNADMPEADIAAAVAAMHDLDAAAGRTPVPVLALVAHDLQAERLRLAGCVETLLKPVSPEDLLEAVERLAPFNPDPTEETVPPETADPQAEAPANARPAVRELPLLDLIITDIDPDHEETPAQPEVPEEKAAPEEEAPCEAFAACDVDQTAGLPQEEFAAQVPAEPEDPQEKAAPEEEAPCEAFAACDVDQTAGLPQEEFAAQVPAGPEDPQEKAAPEEEAPCEAFAACDVDQTAGLPQEEFALPAEVPLAVSEKQALGIDEAAKAPALADAASSAPRSLRRQSISVPLPGENDSVFKDLLPLIPGLIYDLADAMAEAAKGRAEKNPRMVHQAAARVAGKAATFGLTQLERIARCVERAAAADDIEPMECVLDDLENWVARYKEALRALHRDMQW